MTDEQPLYICATPGCEEDVAPQRHALGYKTCLFCGSKTQVRTIAVPYNKGAYQLVLEGDIQDLGK